MTWITAADGQRLHLHPADIAINSYSVATLAHHIAQINRFSGATSRPYSVAEHSLLCADIAREQGLDTEAQLAALVHDLHEAIIGDISAPMKSTLGAPLLCFERAHQRAMLSALGLRWWTRNAGVVKKIDLIALATERRDLLPKNAAAVPWPIIDTPGREVQPHKTIFLDTAARAERNWAEWRDTFTARFDALRKAMQ